MEPEKHEAAEPIQPGTQAEGASPPETESQPPQGEQAAPAAGDRDPYEQTLKYDQVPREVWDYAQRGVEAGELPQETLQSWRKNAHDRQARTFQAHRDLVEMRRALRSSEHGSQPEAQPAGGTPEAAPTAASLRSALGEDEASILGEGTVGAVESYVQQRVQEAVEPLRQQIAAQQPSAADVAAQRAQEARAGLRERFPQLADDAVWEDVIDRADALVGADIRYRVGDPGHGLERALADAAHLTMLDRFGPGYSTAPAPPPPAASTVPPQPASPPAPQLVPVPTGGIATDGAQRAENPALSYKERQALAVQQTMRDMRSGRTPNVNRNRQSAGLPPLPD
jgi:hypothetical protein